MKILLETSKSVFKLNDTITVRLVVLNDSYQPLTIDRRLLVGPNIKTGTPLNPTLPLSIEPAFAEEGRNQIILNPWCFYGRQRNFQGLPKGTATFFAYMLQHPTGSLLPDKPGNPEMLLAAAEPLMINIR
jgi:hypothetical protein